MKLFIPIIGSISAGKSTFLKGFLGIDSLETGINVTTKFVCLIQNSTKTSFYHVLLSKQNNNIIITKDGEELNEANKIKNKIEELNKKYASTNANKNEIFYMLETPIKNINNPELLNNCIFMDIPGLNEANKNYIDEIFSIIKLENILFQILIFDATSFQSDKNTSIISQLDRKKCLQKTGNLYILNKIDNFSNTTPGGELNNIENFKFDFYQNFDKNSNKNVSLNIYENYFIPMNSILYNAETKFENDFCSWLTIELFSYLGSFNNEFSSFFEYLEKRLSNILAQNEIKEDAIENDCDKITDEEINKIKEGVDTLNDILTKTVKSENFIFGIKMEKSKTKKVMKKLYIIHTKKMIGNLFHSKFYDELQEFIKGLKGKKEDNLPSPPPVSVKIQNEPKYKEDEILKEMKDFLKEKLENQFENLNSTLKAVEKCVFGRKIQISFIGPMSVGKSTVLNCIIGEQLLPMKMEECTYRGIIIKHEPNYNDFYLYKVKSKIINENCGLKEFTVFVEEPNYYCKGVENIESFLTTKNNDKEILDVSDAFIIVKGKLKIFDYIKLEQDLINKIEFVDLPGYDRKINVFNENQYYNKILKFSNSCIYINTAETISGNENFNRMSAQYKGDKNNIFSTLQPKFIDTCLFLINKSDQLTKEKDKQQAENNLKNNISKIEPLVENNKNRINVSFFSGLYFFQYLKDYQLFVSNMENNPLITLKKLFKQWSSNKFYFFNFKKYIIDKVTGKIEDSYDDIDDKKAPKWFYDNLKKAFNQLYYKKYRGISEKEEDEIITNLYNIYELFKNKDFSKTKYSNKFFDDLKRMIICAENLQKENFYKNFEAFFQSADELFARTVEKEAYALKKKSQDNYKFFIYELIPDVEKLIIEKENIIKSIINKGKEDCISEIDYDMGHIESILDEYDYDLNKAFNVLQERLEKKINIMQNEQEKVANNIIEDIKIRAKEKIKSHYESENFPMSEINVKIDETYAIFGQILVLSLIAIGKILGLPTVIGAGTGLLIGIGIAFGASLTIGTAVIVSLGIAGGLVIGIIVGAVGYFFAKYKKRGKYKEALENSKSQLINKFKDVEYSFTDHFKTFKDTLISELKLKTEIYLKRINNDKSEWQKIQQEYEVIKKNTKQRIKNKFNFDI